MFVRTRESTDRYNGHSERSISKFERCWLAGEFFAASGGVGTMSVMSLSVLVSSLQRNTANNADPENVGPALREVEQMGIEQRGDDVLNYEKRPDPTLHAR